MARGRRRASGRSGGSGTVTQQLGPARRATRAAKRERRRRQRRLRAGLGTVLAVALAVAAIGYVVSRTVGGDDDKAEVLSRTQQTLLLQLAAADRTAIAGAVIAYDPVPRTSSMVLLPAQTMSEAPGYGSLPLAQVLKLAGSGVSKQAVSDLLVGVRIDHDWTLDPTAFAALVDGVGGVVVDIDRDLTRPGPGNTTVTVLRAGAGQRLDGATAVQWAGYVARGEDPLSALPRFQSVVEGVLAELPPEPSAYTATLSALGAGSKTSWKAPELAAFLDGVRDQRAAERFEAAILPVTPLETGAPVATYGVKADEVTALVERTMAASVPPERRKGDRRVIVENGVGTPGIGVSVAAKLSPAGYDIVTTRNALRLDHETSVVLIFDASDAARTRGLDVARLLGLPETAVQLSTLTQTVADIIVIVGKDYKA